MRTTNALDGVLSLVPEVVKGEECYTEWCQVVRCACGWVHLSGLFVLFGTQTQVV